MDLTLQNVGVFGGGFDPPHNAHVRLVKTAIAALRLDAVFIVPTGQAGHKLPAKTPAAHRLAMTRLAFQDIPLAIIDDCEIRRAGPSWMVDTLAALRFHHISKPADGLGVTKWHLILGADQLARFESWVQWQNIARDCELAVASRPADPGADVGQAIDQSTWLKKGVRVNPLPFEKQALSSSALRGAIRSEGCHVRDATWRDAVPADVAAYICQNGLYQTA